MLAVLHTTSSTPYRTLSQTLYIDDAYLHRINCFICYIFTSSFRHTHHHFPLVSIISFHLMKHQMAWKKKEKKCHFPSNPRYGVKNSPTPNDLQALGDCQILKTQLLDCLPQRSAPPPNEDHSFLCLSSKPRWHTIIHGELQRFG